MDLRRELTPVLALGAHDWLDAGLEEAAADPQRLPVLFPQLRRRLGTAGLDAGRRTLGDMDVDLGAWRTCDVGGLLLIDAADPGPPAHVDLFLHGDMEERTIALRALALRPVSAATSELLGEVQRSNVGLHLEAAALDSDVVVRALRDGGDDAGFTRDDFHRLILKMAFVDLPLARMFGALDEADAGLSTMLQDFATEREAAGRKVWVDTYRLIGRAPAAGTVARLLGGLEHGSDPVRLAAAEGLAALGDVARDVRPLVQERIGREPVPAIREILAAITAR